ncbi:TrmB family transcriptional regulator [Pseudonocardia hierapolitana]|uniref:TrmB family transcriptional regulator n=1 Tax=Pseudonocardia hierapolitana TaxID=1128676 RepID=A0A561SQ55_9PSEU|nr:MarR family transcriptional regulator [Pseudonocardia hierapolitana]TWF76994.1 TrmB family transcriptional regulator [Pseudonocardia hierapolitana]
MSGSSEVAERLALALNQNGMQRMIARVLAAFLFSERESVTAAELGEQLGASAGSISGAITMLRTVGLIEPAPVPGSRRAHFRMRDDAWATMMSSQNEMIQVMQEIAEAGIASAPPDSPAARRLERMRDFYAYLFAELPALIDRWKEEQDT